MTTEVLPPALTRTEARAEINDARKYYQAAARSILLFCAHLRRLQNGNAHHTYGYGSFADFCVAEISPELTKAAVERFSWEGSVILALERAGRLSLDARSLPVGTTGARALATILTQQGEAAMLDTFDLARSLKPGPLSDATVSRARRELAPPRPVGALAQPADAPTEPASYSAPDLEPYDPEQLAGELLELRRILDDLSADARSDPAAWAALSAKAKTAARREMKAIRQRMAQLDEALGG